MHALTRGAGSEGALWLRERRLVTRALNPGRTRLAFLKSLITLIAPTRFH